MSNTASIRPSDVAVSVVSCRLALFGSPSQWQVAHTSTVPPGENPVPSTLTWSGSAIDTEMLGYTGGWAPHLWGGCWGRRTAAWAASGVAPRLARTVSP